MKFRRVISNNLLILRYYFKYVPGYTFANILFTVFVSAVWTLSGPITTKFIIDALTRGKSFREIISFLVIVSGMLILRHIYACIVVEYMLPVAMVTLQEKTRQELFEKASRMDLEYYETPKFYTDFVWAASQADQKMSQVFNTTLNFIARLSELLFMGGVMLVLDPTLFLFALVSITVRIFFSRRIVKKRFEMEQQAKPIERERDYSSRIFYMNDYAKEIRLSKIHESLMERFRKACQSMIKIYKAGGKRLALYNISSAILQEVFASFGMYVYLAYRILIAKALTFGDFGALSESTYRFSGRVKQVVDLCITFTEHSLYIEKFRDFLQYQPSIEWRKGCKPIEKLQPIIFRNVSFKYNGEDTPSLKDINLTIQPGEKIAIVGYNGAGKSTLIKLLLRLYNVSEGEILLGDTNIQEMDTEEYRKEFGAVFQDYQIFAATLGENVVMDFAEEKQKQKIEEALELSQFSERLNDMPRGLETPLTREFQQDGVNLSGGESQKVAISRVFFKTCRYAIMDEPSSALDPISEYKLNQSMMEIARDKTVIFISHRLSTTIMANRIYMLEKGEIIEQGTHQELMQKNGKYAEMFLKQAEKYRDGSLA